MKKHIILNTICILILSACQNNKQPYDNEELLSANHFENKEIGWKMNIPVGWKVDTKKDANKRVLEGYEIIESSTSEEYNKSQISNILSFRKDFFNRFSSTIEKFDVDVHGEWKKVNSDLKKIIYNTYLGQNIKVDSSETNTEIIDGISFITYQLTLYNENNEIAVKQILYSALINGFDFGVNLNYNNDSDRDLLLKHWRDSKFLIK